LENKKKKKQKDKNKIPIPEQPDWKENRTIEKLPPVPPRSTDVIHLQGQTGFCVGRYIAPDLTLRERFTGSLVVVLPLVF